MIDVQDAPVNDINVKMPKGRGRREALAVNYAAKRLDEICLGWEYSIMTFWIDMSSFEYCILGQIFGTYTRGLHKWHSHGATVESASPFGVPVFNGGRSLITSHRIKKAWRREIKARK